MKFFVLILISLIQVQIIQSQEIFNRGVLLNYKGNGTSFSGNPITQSKSYHFYKDTCINGSTYIVLKYSDTINPAWPTNETHSIFIDTFNKKIHYNQYFNTLKTKGIIIYDFNLKIGDVNQYGFTLIDTSIKMLWGKLRKLYYFRKQSPCYTPFAYDIWVENFGSIVQDYRDPFEVCSADWIRYFYASRINIGNIWELNNSQNQIPHSNFSFINKISNMNLPIYLSYKCNNNIDTIYTNSNSCATDSQKRFDVKLIIDESKNYKCLDSINYKITITPIDSTKIITWLSSKETIVNYPTNKYEDPLYYNGVWVKNQDSTCEVYIQSRILNVQCDYCDNPQNKISATLFSDKVNYKCLDTIKYKLYINGSSTNKRIQWLGDSIQIVKYPTIYNSTETYSTYLIISNSDSSCSQYLQSFPIDISCLYCDNPIHNPRLDINYNKDTFCQDTLQYQLTSNGESDSLWIFHTPKINYTQHGNQKVSLHFGNRHCIRDSINKQITIKCNNSSIQPISSYFEQFIYPNPVSDYLYIKFKDNSILTTPELEIQINLTNILGQHLPYSFKYDGKEKWLLDVRNLNNGIYFLSISQDRFKYNTVIQVQH